MTLKQWFEFNEDVLSTNEWIVCILKNGSYKKDDVILEAKMRAENAIPIFGDCQLKRVQIASLPPSDFMMPRLLLWNS